MPMATGAANAGAMKIAASGQLLSEAYPLEEVLRVFTKFGLKWIELWPHNIAPIDTDRPHWPSRYEGRDLVEAKRLMDQYEISPMCLTVDGAFGSLWTDPDDYVANFLSTIDLAVEWGISRINHYCYNFALGVDADYRPFVDLLAPVISHAERVGVTLLLENEAHDATARPERMLEIMKSVDSPAFKTTYDATNYYQASAEPFPGAYEILKPYIGHVHIKNGNLAGAEVPIQDSLGGAFTGSIEGSIYYAPLPDGAVNISGLLARLREDGYDGFATIEPHTTPAWAEHYYRVETDFLRKEGVFHG